ncbi:MAG: hypothetical protein RR623_10135 [Bacilli bacterium]
MNENNKAIKFLKEWRSAISQDDRINFETYGDTNIFTSIVLKENLNNSSCIMKKISNSLYNNLDQTINASYNDHKNEDYPEYFKIDYTIWRNYTNPVPELFKKFNLNKHCSKMLLAMEHENNGKDWTDEFAKLFSVHCELRVVVGYFDYETYEIDLLIIFLEKLTKKMLENCTSFFGEYLLILGLPQANFKEDSNSQAIADGYRGFQLIDNNGDYKWEELKV